MAVVPAKCRVDLGRMRLLLRDSRATLPKGGGFAGTFWYCDTEAMQAFDNPYGIPLYLGGDLIGEETLAFPAGSHHEVICIPFKNLLRLTGAHVQEFCKGEQEGTRGTKLRRSQCSFHCK
jgi:Ala-tRNA(Pro) deacylase